MCVTCAVLPCVQLAVPALSPLTAPALIQNLTQCMAASARVLLERGAKVSYVHGTTAHQRLFAFVLVPVVELASDGGTGYV